MRACVCACQMCLVFVVVCPVFRSAHVCGSDWHTQQRERERGMVVVWGQRGGGGVGLGGDFKETDDGKMQ